MYCSYSWNVMPTNQKKIPNIIKSLQSSSQWRPLAAVWPHPLFLAHLFLLSSHCFAERGVARCQIGSPGCCWSPIRPTPTWWQLTHALPRPLCASRAIAVPSVGDRSAIISESNAILEDCGIECHIVGLPSVHLLHSDTLTTHTQTSSHAVHCHAHPVCSPLH